MARTYADAVRSALARRTVKSAARSLSDQLTEDLKFDRLVGHPANPPVPTTGPAWRSTGEKLVPHGKTLEDAKRREAVVKAVTDSLSNIKDAPRRALSGVSTTVDDLKDVWGGVTSWGRKLYNAARRKTVQPPARLKAPGVAPAALDVPTHVYPSFPEPVSLDAHALASSAPTIPAPLGLSAALTPPSGADLVRAPDPDVGRAIDPAAVRRGALVSAVEQRLNSVSEKVKPTYEKLVAALKSPRGMAVAGGVALAGGGAALAYKLMSDYIERKRKEKRMRQRKTAAAALPTFPIAPSSTAPSTFVLPRPLPEYKGGRGGRAGLIVALLGALAAAGRGVMAYRRPQSAYDKLVAALKSPMAKRIGVGLGATALGAGVGVGAASLRDKLRTGGANSPDGDARGKKENPEA